METTPLPFFESSPIASPVGKLWLSAERGSITRLSWQCQRMEETPAHRHLYAQVVTWLAHYFREPKTAPFPPPLPLSPRGTPFQQSVWQQILTIPAGQTMTYGQIARSLGSAPRAVGQAVGANPLAILIPCHRVTGQAGLGGYSGGEGIETKKWLLTWEKNTRMDFVPDEADQVNHDTPPPIQGTGFQGGEDGAPS